MESWSRRFIEFTTIPNAEQCKPVARFGRKILTNECGVQNSIPLLKTNNKDVFKSGFSGRGMVTVTIKSEYGEPNCQLLRQMVIDSKSFMVNAVMAVPAIGVLFKNIPAGGIDLRNKNIAIRNIIHV